MMTFSPTPRPPPVDEAVSFNKENSGNKSTEKELTLVCAKFQEILVVDFGCINFGPIKSVEIQLRNPNPQKEVNITIAKVPKKSGVSIVLGVSNSEESAVIPAASSIPAIVYWSPVQNHVKMREVIGLKMDAKSPLQITVQGTCGHPELQVSTHKYS